MVSIANNETDMIGNVYFIEFILVMLDGKEVNEATRLFLQSWQANKEMKKAMQKQKEITAEYLVDVPGKDDRLPDVRMHQDVFDPQPLVTEGSFIISHSMSLVKQTKGLLARGNKAPEHKDTTGNVVKAI